EPARRTDRSAVTMTPGHGAESSARRGLCATCSRVLRRVAQFADSEPRLKRRHQAHTKVMPDEIAAEAWALYKEKGRGQWVGSAKRLAGGGDVQCGGNVSMNLQGVKS